MKKRITLLLAAMLAMTAVCGLAAYTPGTFTGEGQGMNGTVKVDVTFSEDAITEITVGENQETPGVSDPAIAQLPGRIVEAQSLAVDTVTGATFTSNGILAAVADAVAQAGGDAEALRKVEVTKAVGEAVVAELEPVQKKYNEYIKDKAYLAECWNSGAEKASRIAGRTLSKAMKKIGFVLK